MYLFEKQCVYLYHYVSACVWFQRPNCETWWFIWMYKGCMCHANVLDSKAGFKTTNKPDIVSPVTVQWESKIDISDKICYQSSSEGCCMSHRRSTQWAIQPCLKHGWQDAFIHATNCITLNSNLKQMVMISNIAYNGWLKSQRMSWMWNGEDVRL